MAYHRYVLIHWGPDIGRGSPWTLLGGNAKEEASIPQNREWVKIYSGFPGSNKKSEGEKFTGSRNNNVSKRIDLVVPWRAYFER